MADGTEVKTQIADASPPTSQPFLIALTGPVGSGVTTVSKILEQQGFHRLSMSKAIKDLYQEREAGDDPPTPQSTFDYDNLEDGRKKLQDIGDEKRRERADYWVIEALKRRPDSEKLVIDGIRNPEEIRYLRAHFPSCFICAVIASHDQRWERKKDLYNGNQREFDRDDDRDAEDEVSHGQQVDKCVQEADYVLINEVHIAPQQSLEDQLWDKLQNNIALMVGESERYPTPAETHMASAYAASHSSRCLKRFVGALIVAADELPLAIGFNENPVGMKPCESEYHQCYKDGVMEEKLEKMRDIHCPKCGKCHNEIRAPWVCLGDDCGTNFKRHFFPSRNMELCTAIHAEERAIRSLGDKSARGATMYVTTFPCFQCARYIVDAGIGIIVYVEAYPVKEAKEFLVKNEVTIEPFEGFKARAFNQVFKQRS